MDYKILIGKDIKLKHFNKIEELDKKVFDLKYTLSPFKALGWIFKSHSGYVVALNDNGVPIGYSSFVSVTDEYYDMIKSGNVIDVEMPLNAIKCIDRKGFHNLYFSSIVIDPDYQHTKLGFILFKEAEQLLIDFYNKGVYFNRIVVDAVSDNGRKASEILGLHFVKETERNSFIYEIDLFDPKSCLNGKLGLELKNLYQKVKIDKSL